jgi:hypothetical protein
MLFVGKLGDCPVKKGARVFWAKPKPYPVKSIETLVKSLSQNSHVAISQRTHHTYI